MDKLRGIGQFILLVVVLFLPLQAQATIPAGPKDAGKPQDAGKPTHAPEPTYQAPPIDQNDLLEAGLIDCSAYKDIDDNWVYSGGSWTAGMDPKCTSLSDDCTPYWLEAGKPDPGSNEPVIDVRLIHAKDKERAEKDGMGRCFPDPVWGTPDECAYMHDMAYARADRAKEQAQSEEIKGNEKGFHGNMARYNGIKKDADFALVACVSQFTDENGPRNGEFLAMSESDQNYAKNMVRLFKVIRVWNEKWEEKHYAQLEPDEIFGQPYRSPSTLVNHSLNQSSESIIKNLKLAELFNIPTLDMYYSGSGGNGW